MPLMPAPPIPTKWTRLTLCFMSVAPGVARAAGEGPHASFAWGSRRRESARDGRLVRYDRHGQSREASRTKPMIAPPLGAADEGSVGVVSSALRELEADVSDALRRAGLAQRACT